MVVCQLISGTFNCRRKVRIIVANQMAHAINWERFDAELADCYSEEMGRPGKATRLMVGLQSLVM